ncbi:MAG TPA: ATP synthase F1 subunit gamma [Candidatus Binataceae bacterium]|nr:ATP synthase F1 subunit gamma [Candidatus Binataceae bacterium]
MASLKAIRRRIASVKSTQQITRAMKLIAAARLRRAQESLLAARPYSEALTRVADSLLNAEGVDLAPSENAQKRALVAVIAADRGLCGGYNTNILRAGEETRRNLEADGFEVDYYAVGRKAVEHYKRSKASIAVESVNNLPRLATIELARTIASRMLADFQSGAISEASIVYSRFHSAMTQEPTYERLLPVPKQERKAEDGGAASVEYLIEPSPRELVPVVVRNYLEASVFHALLEAEASENGAKMTAMDSATNNASEMIEAYTLEMNRARQAQITKELMDIVGGAEAIRG